MLRGLAPASPTPPRPRRRRRRPCSPAPPRRWRVGAAPRYGVNAAGERSPSPGSPLSSPGVPPLPPGAVSPPAAPFTARPGGLAVRQFRIGSPQGNVGVPDSPRLHRGNGHEFTEAEKRTIGDFTRLRFAVGSMFRQIDDALQMLSDASGFRMRRSASERSIFASSLENNYDRIDALDLEGKMYKLQRAVQESAGDLSSARRRIVHLEVRLREAMQELEQAQAAADEAKAAEHAVRAELRDAQESLRKSQHLITVGEKQASQLEKEADHYQTLAVANIKQRNSWRQDVAGVTSPRNADSQSPASPRSAMGGGTLSLTDALRKHDASRGGKAPPKGPTGRVALVFTDIQGSTNLWELLGDDMHAELEKHNRVIRKEIRQWSGYEVKTQGDSFMVAFANPSLAVAFCMGVQLSLLAAAPWHEKLQESPHAVNRTVKGPAGTDVVIWNGLRVRMGGHVGNPICQVDVTSGRMDYFGPVVNQAARVQGVAYGGMVTLTPEMVDDLDHRSMPPRLSPVLFSIGCFTLKGIAEPVPLQHALPPELVGRNEDFPPLKTKDAMDDREVIANSGAPTGAVTFCLLRMEDAHTVSRLSDLVWQETLKIFQNEVRVSCETMGGYVSRVDDDRLSVVFQHAGVAFRWAMELQESLMRLPWPQELLDSPAGRVTQWRGRDCTRGARAQIGVHACDEVQASVDPITSQVVYIGEAIQVAGALSLQARGGETLVSDAVHALVKEATRDRFILAYEDIKLKDWQRAVQGYLAYPRRLTGRAHIFKGVPLDDFPGIDEDDVDEDVKAAHTEAPFGNVSICFTDIQNSTKLWDSNERLMASVVRMHHVAMRAGIQRFRGYEVKTEGDAFMVAFAAATDAVRWCLYMQETLLALAYPDAFLALPDAKEGRAGSTLIWRGVRVRMGVHSGQPSCEVDPVTKRMDYYGPMVNKAARVSSLAQGGQIVISEDTYEAIKGQFRELGNPATVEGGEHRLKGISKPTRVHFMLPQRLRRRTFATPDKAPPPQEAAGLELMHNYMEQEAAARTHAAQTVAPTGRVALVFTDIQNSTSLWENCERMAQVVQMHHRIMRSGIAQHRGYEVKTEGDAFMVAFSSTIDAVAWCLAMQQELMQAKWDPSLLQLRDAKEETSLPDGRGLRIWCGPRVRMGVHVGGPPDLACETDPVSGRMDYYGKMVNRAARVGGKGKGGETVISGDVYAEIQQGGEAVMEQLYNPDIVFVGEETLKGIAGTTPIYSCVPRHLALRRDTWEEMEKQKAQSSRPPSARWEQLAADFERREQQQKTAPQGVVTLVFTDIQSSTELWDGYSEDMELAVKQHHKLMRDWIGRMRGYEVKTEGDAFMVAFSNALDALIWCVGTQFDLMKQDWPSGMLEHRFAERVEAEDGSLIWNGPRVRMGVHTGPMRAEVDEVSERMDYYGPEVNKAARIGGLGTGGEIVASEEALEEARKVCPDLEKLGRPIIVHLGQKRLKGISKPATAYRIVPTMLANRVYPAKQAAEAVAESDLASHVAKRNSESDLHETQRHRGRRASRDDDTDGRGRHNHLDYMQMRQRHKQELEKRDGEIEALKRDLEKAVNGERMVQLEYWRTHQLVRCSMAVMRKFVEHWADRSKGVYLAINMTHDWVNHFRRIQEIEDPHALHDGIQKSGRGKARPDQELKTQALLAIETEEKERQLGLTQTQVIVSKLAQSVGGLLARHAQVLSKCLANDKGRKQSKGGVGGAIPLSAMPSDATLGPQETTGWFNHSGESPPMLGGGRRTRSVTRRRTEVHAEAKPSGDGQRRSGEARKSVTPTDRGSPRGGSGEEPPPSGASSSPPRRRTRAMTEGRVDPDRSNTSPYSSLPSGTPLPPGLRRLRSDASMPTLQDEDPFSPPQDGLPSLARMVQGEQNAPALRAATLGARSGSAAEHPRRHSVDSLMQTTRIDSFGTLTSRKSGTQAMMTPAGPDSSPRSVGSGIRSFNPRGGRRSQLSGLNWQGKDQAQISPKSRPPPHPNPRPGQRSPRAQRAGAEMSALGERQGSTASVLTVESSGSFARVPYAPGGS
eukprot:TRINITY_DN109_c0_g1_i2.p1 TRINITY_DN109_c0_g1~~TRINITY_DN109_c0_g1_i2.p1  ORF type:complete len:2038 (+),score=469.19 TRINITY_DN109_c0_g1_i2:115-6228(+)